MMNLREHMLSPVHFFFQAPTETTNGTDESKKDRVYTTDYYAISTCVYASVHMLSHGRAKITKRF